MESAIEIPLVKAVILKTKVVIGFFILVVLFQTSVLISAINSEYIEHIPLFYVTIIPIFLSIVILDEFIALRHLKKVLRGEAKLKKGSGVLLNILEISVPTAILWYGIYMIKNYNIPIEPYVFITSPPIFVYFFFIILSSLQLEFKLSALIGFIAGIEYICVSIYTLESNLQFLELGISISKGVLMIICGIVAGLISKKIKASIEESEKSKNILIHQLDKKVSERTKEVEAQREVVEEKNKEIIDSIVYAKRLQTAILPPDKLIKEWIPNSFIHYLPKDIVAGDFYWGEKIDNNIFFAAADCTGHGVPGAMVSVICSNALNRSVKEFNLINPAEILDKVRELVIETFEKSESEVKDGMDISLAVMDLKSLKLQWAGANNPLYIVRKNSLIDNIEELLHDDSSSLIEYKADKQPIGKYASEKPFTNNTIELLKEDTLYMFTDGFPDQFGGERGKKYKSINFKKLILSITSLGMKEQEEALQIEFDSWKKDLEQIDDVCIVGVRI